jgi:ribosomal peptide maturation radical SAM protein 1
VTEADAVLVVMPFADVSRPALGVSILRAAAVAAGIPTRVCYANLAFAARVSVELYAKIADGLPADVLLGEWFFATDVFGDALTTADDYVSDLLSAYVPPLEITHLLDERRRVAGYLDDCAETILSSRPRVVGFTSTFHQTCASVAVAQRLKAAPNPPFIVFGGANCEGEMGEQLLRCFPCIDAVCAGEADTIFVELLRHVLDGAPLPEAGVVTRARRPSGSATVHDLDALPTPDFSDYFDDVATLGLAVPRQLALETARGCWWGERRHCTFCGLNGATMGFRSKTPDRAYREIVDVCTKHHTTTISFVDNILDPGYIASLFPRLAASDLTFDLFFEVKANLHCDELAALKAGGVRHIQPGIESLSDDVLRLMRKGVTAFQNIQLLRWAAELDISCSWNIICGFPGEPPAAYEAMAELIPSLVHLPPPSSSARVRLDRFSPFHADPETFGFTRVRPARAYFYVYPFGRRDLYRLAYFFDYDYADGRDVDSYYGPVGRAVQAWWDEWRRDGGPRRLEARADGDDFFVTDTRPGATREEHWIHGLPAAVLAVADKTTTVTQLLRSPHIDATVAEVVVAVESLVEDRLLARSGGQLIALPVFRDRPSEHPILATDKGDRRDAQASAVPALLHLGRSS